MQAYEKDPDARRDFAIDWSEWLATGETIASSTWAVPAGITEISSISDDTTATIRVSGGTAGQRYVLTNTITASGGEIEPRSIAIWIREQ